MKKKRTDIFIYTAAAVSCVIMILLLTTSSSISYSLYDEAKPGDNSQLISAKTPHAESRQQASMPVLPELKTDSVEDIISNITKPTTSTLSSSGTVVESPLETVQIRKPLKKTEAEDLTEDENEIDKLIIDILLNNQSALHSQMKQEPSDKVLDIYQSDTFSRPENSEKQDGHQTYTVCSGDCLYNIALAHGMTLSKLVELNHISNPNLIHQGEKLLLEPAVSGTPERKDYLVYHIQKDDTIQKIAERYKLDRGAIIRLNDLSEDRVLAGQTLYLPYRPAQNLSKTPVSLKAYRWPLSTCQISSPYGARPDPLSPDHEVSFHPGLDLAASMGDKIMAVQDEKVVFAGRKNGYGNMVIISHPDGYLSVYGHAQIVFVKTGQSIVQGQVIARVGSSGKSTGPHLHFELRKYARTIDPRSVITASRH